ncbi:phosphotransferase [Streptosporangium sp. NBC_01495]
MRERAANRALPAGIPAPRLLWADDVDGWHLLLFEHAPGREADLTPGSPHISAVVNAVAAISVPCPWAEAPSVTVKVAALLRQAEMLMAESPAEYARYGPLVKALDLDEFNGTVLLHADLHAGNLLVDGGRCWVVDWSMACQGAAWVDVALWIPRLIDAAPAPADAEEVAARVPAWGSAPEDAGRYPCPVRRPYGRDGAGTSAGEAATDRRSLPGMGGVPHQLIRSTDAPPLSARRTSGAFACSGSGYQLPTAPC